MQEPTVKEEKPVAQKSEADDQPVQLTSTIGEVVQKYPQVAEVFMSYGLHCVGCHVAYWETVEQGAKGHGMDDATLANMIKDANAVATETAKSMNDDKEVHLSDKAIEKAKELMKKEGKENEFLRIDVVEGGCSGMSYNFVVDQEQKEDDVLIEKNGLKVLINKARLPSLQGARIDYIETMQASGFKIDNPNAKATCGCGNSFS